MWGKCGENPKNKNRLIRIYQQIRRFYWYPEPGSNRHGHCWPQDFKSGVSTDSTIRAQPSAGKTSAKVRNNLRSAKSRRWNRCRFVFRSRDLHLQPRSPTRSLAEPDSSRHSGFLLRLAAPFRVRRTCYRPVFGEAFSEAGSVVTVLSVTLRRRPPVRPPYCRCSRGSPGRRSGRTSGSRGRAGTT